ncbi:MAG TPA: dihydrodipicolinate synthase family protein [Geminicoccus sp.]|uniref:dihydrodipicolinate synthase family protein n=1 Tax=Geminicoccus sp. TaxID=2024832 RepID=UPI002E2F6B8C|nr:dihydrodipicolinate synthase family protein [Geminicoccus sp.]HEX2528127.1 dihydrodipicolinate synthase family protein [Geminicoccus sp.]
MSGERFGLAAALATPFTEDGSIDLQRLVRHASWCLANGCGRVTLFGTTGEGASIDDDEREPVWQALEAVGIGGHQLVGGVAASTISSAARQAAQAYDHGAHAVLLAPPYYFKGVDDEGLFRWFAALIERLGGQARDLLLYNIPSVTSVTLSVALVTRLAQAFPGVVTGVKDSSGDWPYTEALLAAHARDLTILVGDERHLARAVRMGGAGAISGLANLCPEILLPLAEKGQDDPRIVTLVDDLCRLPVIPAVKALVALQSDDGSWASVRPPLLPAPDAAIRDLGRSLEAVRRPLPAGKAA